MSLLHDGLKAMGLDQDPEKIKKLERYIKEIELWNPRYGLVNAEGDQLVIRHILDSLSGVSVLDQPGLERVADIGSGAGLPGIPLAVFLPGTEFFLVERSGRRVSFLRNAVLTLGIKNVTIVEKALEKLEDRYDAVTFRGFSPFNPELIVHLRRILAEEGRIFAYKGRMSQIREELHSLEGGLGEKAQITAVTVPMLSEERHIVTLCL